MTRNPVGRPGENYFSSSDFATAGVPIVNITYMDHYNDGDDDDGIDEEYNQILPLPASKYRYSKWCELDNTDITSDMLKAPRVRKAPSGFKFNTVWMLEEQEKNAVRVDQGSLANHQNKSKGRSWGMKKKQVYDNKLEKWESCDLANLSYQDLGHAYQMKEFLKVLRRLVRAEMIELIENSLMDLSSVSFPKCKFLFLQRNHLTNLKKLPKFNSIEHISLQQNNITDLKGLEVLKNTTIKSLILRENPVALQPDYRKRVFTILPNLIFLDDLPRLPGNEEQHQSASCSIF